MTEQTSTYLCNSAVITPAEYKKTVEYNLGKKEEIGNFAFQSKNSRVNTVEYIPAEKRWNATEQALNKLRIPVTTLFGKE